MAVNDNHINVGLVNIQSTGNKTLEIKELINDNKLDIFVVTETWIDENETAKITEMTPETHLFVHKPRVGKERGGGVGLFISNMFTHVRKTTYDNYTMFEYLTISFKHLGQNFLIVIIYRPPTNLIEKVNTFLDEFESLLEQLDMISHNIFFMGDFNFWMNIPHDRYACLFKELLNNHQLVNHVWPVTSRTNHTLDLIITDESNNLISGISVEERNTISPVHKLITFQILVPKSRITKRISFRNNSEFSPSEFLVETVDRFGNNAQDSCPHEVQLCVSDCADCLTETYNSVFKENYENCCPIREKEIVVKDKSPWFNGETLALKREKRRKEHKWHRLKTVSAYEEYKMAKNNYKK